MNNCATNRNSYLVTQNYHNHTSDDIQKTLETQ